jgi:hypothetical protein
LDDGIADTLVSVGAANYFCLRNSVWNREFAKQLSASPLRHGHSGTLTTVLPEPFVREKEKSFVFYDWAANRPAEVILTERRLGVRHHVKIIPGVEKIIPQIIERRAMELIGAGFRNNRDLRPALRQIQQIPDAEIRGLVKVILARLWLDNRPFFPCPSLHGRYHDEGPCVSFAIYLPRELFDLGN